MNFTDSVKRSDSKIQSLDYQKLVYGYQNHKIEVKMAKGNFTNQN